MAKAELIEPTPERLSKAEGCWYKARDKRGQIVGGTVVYDAPIERMRDQKIISDQQYDAAMKFYAHWYGAGQVGVKAIDYSRSKAEEVFGNLDPSEAHEFHVRKYREACKELGIRGDFVMRAIVCAQMSPVSVGNQLGWNNDPQARAVATELLKDALDRLRNLWGM